MYLIDTNILIYASKGDKRAVAFLREHQHMIAVSLVTYYETLNYELTEAEAIAFRALFSAMPLHPIDRTIVDQALQNRQHKKIKMADNFILSTAQVHDLTIVTHNTKDFAQFVRTIDPLD
jgi:predicted nucleic acid-binding protein